MAKSPQTPEFRAMVSQEHLDGIGSYDTKILRRMPMTQPAYIFAYYFVRWMKRLQSRESTVV